MAYEKPSITVVGTVSALTLGRKGRGRGRGRGNHGGAS